MTPAEQDVIITELFAIEAWLCLLMMALNDADSEPTRETLRTALLDLQVRVGRLKALFTQ